MFASMVGLIVVAAVVSFVTCALVTFDPDAVVSIRGIILVVS